MVLGLEDYSQNGKMVMRSASGAIENTKNRFGGRVNKGAGCLSKKTPTLMWQICDVIVRSFASA